MIWLEVSTLFEPAWSGIANVTANICQELLVSGRDVRFFCDDLILAPDYVFACIERRDGQPLQVLLEHGFASEGSLYARKASPDELAIFPNLKGNFHRFSRELLIVHDLSFVLTPELHDHSRIEVYRRGVYRDARSVHHVCCVSEATRRDLIRYFAIPREKTSVVHLGVSQARFDKRLISTASQGEYCLILGTIEPRKNIELVLRFLRHQSIISEKFKFVFVGKNGWGPTFEETCERVGVSSQQVVHLGYVDEDIRRRLVKNAACLIFPTLFEGFGLPVVEAMVAGIPVLASRSSSIVELGLRPEHMFDPCNDASFAEVVTRFLLQNVNMRLETGRENARKSSKFLWSSFVRALPAPFSGT